MDDQGKCPEFFLASDVRLPQVDRRELRQPFWARELTAQERKTFPQFSKQYVYYVGAYTGCCRNASLKDLIAIEFALAERELVTIH